MPGINAEKIGKIDGKWYSIPFIANTTGTFFRGDKLKEKGIDPQSLKTWQQRADAALAISDPDNEFWGWGNTVNQSGDGWGIASGILNAFGGHFTDASGTKVTFYSPETVAAFEFVKTIYDRNGKYAPMLPPGVESWGDISNNEAFLAGKRRLHAQRLLGLCGGQARQQSDLPGHRPAAPADPERRHQHGRRAGRWLADHLQELRRISTWPRNWRSICSTRTTSRRCRPSRAAC